MQKYRFEMTEDASPAYSTPNDVSVRRELCLQRPWEIQEGDVLVQAHETYLRFMENVGHQLAMCCSTMHATMLQYLRVKYPGIDATQFFRKLDENLQSVESVAAGAANPQSQTEDPPEGFESFCESIAQRGEFARRVYREFMDSFNN